MTRALAKKRMWLGVLLGSALVVVVPTMPASAAIERNNAAGFRSGSYLDTGWDLSKLRTGLTAGHTLVARFAAKYPYTNAETILGVRGPGNFSIGLADFREAQPGTNWAQYTKRRAMRVVLGNNTAIFRPALSDDDKGGTGKWTHVAVTFKAKGANVAVRVFVNQAPAVISRCACAINPSGYDMIVSPSTLTEFQGNLIIGQIANKFVSIKKATEREQFWGLIDDVGIFKRALGFDDIGKLINNPLVGKEPNLVAAYTFDDYDTPTPSKVFRTKSHGDVARPNVGLKRTQAAAQAALAKVGIKEPNGLKFRLPFKPGEAWLVSHGNSTPNSSHNGFAAFAWDFVRHGVANDETCGREARALANGKVTFADDVDNPWEANGNQVRIEYDPHLHSNFLHIQRNSFQSLFGTRSIPFAVTKGQRVARVGGREMTVRTPLDGSRTGCHLHMGISDHGRTPTTSTDDKRSSNTIPSQYWDYELLVAGKWIPIKVGVPKTGDIVRNPPQ